MEATVYAVKVRSAETPRWSFLGRTGSTPLRIHAAQFPKQEDAVITASEVAEGNEGYEAKAVNFNTGKTVFVTQSVARIVKKPTPEIFTRADVSSGTVYQFAKKKARYSHKDWLFWTQGDEHFAAPFNEKNLKAAMLTTGTMGHIVLHHSCGGCGTQLSWRCACYLFQGFRRRISADVR